MRIVFDYDLKIHSKYLDSNIQKHIETAVYNLKDRGVFNRMCITNIRNVYLVEIQVTNGQSDHIAYLKIEADYINLEVGEVYSGILTHAILNKKTCHKNRKSDNCFCGFRIEL